jgi:hypothetical protein
MGESSGSISGKLTVTLAAGAGDPVVENRYRGAVERDNVGAISRRELTKPVAEAENSAG